MRLHLSQFVFHGDIEWSVHRECDGCGVGAYECGRGDTPEPLRAALVDQCGLAHLRVDDTGSRPLRVRLMKGFRDAGASLVEAREACERLAGEGMTGTHAEMQLLAERLGAAGATPSVT